MTSERGYQASRVILSCTIRTSRVMHSHSPCTDQAGKGPALLVLRLGIMLLGHVRDAGLPPQHQSAPRPPHVYLAPEQSEFTAAGGDRDPPGTTGRRVPDGAFWQSRRPTASGMTSYTA